MNSKVPHLGGGGLFCDYFVLDSGESLLPTPGSSTVRQISILIVMQHGFLKLASKPIQTISAVFRCSRLYPSVPSKLPFRS